MRVLMILPLAAMMVCAAETPSADKATASSANITKPQAAAPKAVQLPAGAVQVGPNSYRYTYPDGRTETFAKTPFGFLTSGKTAAPAAGEPTEPYGATAVEDGDTVRFARLTPLGIIRWQRKKSELNETEKAIWERQSSHQGSTQE